MIFLNNICWKSIWSDILHTAKPIPSRSIRATKEHLERNRKAHIFWFAQRHYRHKGRPHIPSAQPFSREKKIVFTKKTFWKKCEYSFAPPLLIFDLWSLSLLTYQLTRARGSLSARFRLAGHRAHQTVHLQMDGWWWGDIMERGWNRKAARINKLK